MKYAKNLLGLYKHLIKPFLVENAQLLEKESERLTRFLYMDLRNDPELAMHVGKSFSNAVHSKVILNPHFSSGWLYRLN